MTTHHAKRNLRKLAAAAGTAAGVALPLLGVTQITRAQLVYEGFDYTPGSSLDGRTNPGTGLPWSRLAANVSDDNIVVGGTSVAHPGFAAPTGGSVTYAGPGESARTALGDTVRSGTLYYSLTLNVTGLGTMTSDTLVPIAGFTTASGAGGQPTTIGARLYLRKGSSPGGNTFNVGISKNSGALADIAFDTTERPLNTPLLVVGGYQIVGTTGGQDDVARLYVNPTSLGSAAAPTTSTPASPILTAPVNGTDLTTGSTPATSVPALASFMLRQGSNVPAVEVDEIRVDTAWARVTPPAGTSWGVDGGGAWSDGGRWSTAAAPSASNAFVNFNNILSAGASIEVDSAVSLRTVTFDSPHTYTLGGGGGGGGSLNFSTSAGANVRAGHHAINVPVSLGGETLLTAAGGASLAFGGDMTGNGQTLVKAGAGSVAFKHVRAGDVRVLAGTAAVQHNGTSDATSRVASLTIAPGAKLDLGNNRLITTSPLGVAAPGPDSTRVYSGISGYIQAANNPGTGDWQGASGITTSMPNAITTGTETLGSAIAGDVLPFESDTILWGGQTVSMTDTIVMYTHTGDANLDGVVDGGDYAFIDAYVGTTDTAYYKGDFNYDGFIDGGDYAYIDVTVGSGAFVGAGGSVPASAAAVPEPGAAVIAILVPAVAAIVPRRRRRRSRLAR